MSEPEIRKVGDKWQVTWTYLAPSKWGSYKRTSKTKWDTKAEAETHARRLKALRGQA